MAAVSACPNVDVLEQLALGRLPPAEFEHLAKHCENCPHCVQILHSLKTQDTLIEAMAAQKTAPERKREPDADALIERLKRMPPALASEMELTATVAGVVGSTVDIALAPPQAADELGRLGGYRVLKKLGAGGMGMVYHAEDVHLQRPIALKVMKAEVANNAGNRERFLREARAAAKLKSDHVVNIYQVGEDRQVVFLAMEYLEGMALDDWLKKGRKPSMIQTARIGRQIALGLADAHACGLIHRDIKPGIVVVVQKDDGRQELLEPADFEQKYGWKNEPDRVHLLKPLPPPMYPQPGMPMGPYALVREPAELPDVNSWTIETVNSRGHVQAVAYRPDGKLLATGGEDGTIRLWDVSSGKLVRMLIGEPVLALSWSKDGKVLSTFGRREGQGRRWDVDTGRLLCRTSGAAKQATQVAGSPDGKQVATVGEQGIQLSDTVSGKRTHTLENTLSGGIFSLNWSPDGRSLALGSNFAAGLRVVEAATGRQGLGLTEYERAAAWSPDGRTLAVFGHDSRVHLLETVSHRLVRTIEGGGMDGVDLAWTTDGKLLAGVAHSSFHVWSAQTGKHLWRKEPQAKDQRATTVAWSPDGRQLATAVIPPDKGALRIWEAETGKQLHEFPLSIQGGLAWSLDGKYLVAVPMYGGEGLLIDARTGTVRLKLKAGNGNCSVRWSSDGKTFTTLGNQGLLREWDAAKGEVRRTVQLTGVLGVIAVAAWSPNGRVLACASGNVIHLHEEDGHPLGVLLPFDTFGRLAVTADGRYRGNARVERLIRMVVQKRDGSSETLTPRQFAQKYGFKNEPDKVRLTEK